MPTRVQSLKYGVGGPKQINGGLPDIDTLSPSFIRFRKLNLDIHTLKYNTETDAAEIGKGSEFATAVYPVAYDIDGRIEKYASPEFNLWAWGYALGNSTGSYSIAPIDPNVTLELPYFTIVQQLGEGGGSAIDEAYKGCAIEDVETTFNYGPGRQSLKTTVNFVGSGRHVVAPTSITLPAVQAEKVMLSQSAAISINDGVQTFNYVTKKTALSGTISWKNNLLRNAGYFIGSGLVDGAAVRGRIEIGARVCGFQFTVRMLSGDAEYLDMITSNKTGSNGSVSLTFYNDSTDPTHNFVSYSMPNARFQAIERTEVDGIAAMTITVAPISITDNGVDVLTVTGDCSIASLAQ